MAVAIIALVSAQLGLVAVGAYRLIRRTFAEAELSLAAREWREKMLFHARPTTASTVTGGLLSATDTAIPWRIEATLPYVDLAKASRGRLHWNAVKTGFEPVYAWNAVRNANDVWVSEASSSSAADRWLFTCGIPLAYDADTWTDAQGSGAGCVDTYRWQNTKNVSYAIHYRASASGVEYAQRLYVPVFGKLQDVKGGTFGDD